MEGEIVGRKYKLIKKLGCGTFGDVYLSINERNMSEEYATKLEKKKAKSSQLMIEYKLYQYFHSEKKIYGIPQIYYWGTTEEYNVMVMELLGPSLEDIFQFCNNKFSLKTTLMIIDQCIKRVEFIHSKDIIHRDIKPDNFVMGRNNYSNVVYPIDFGISKKYRDSRTKTHIKYSENKNLVGTARYASLNNHLGREQSRRDDMESLAYMFIYLMKGKLPWQGISGINKHDKYQKILAKKQMISPESLCEGLPNEFSEYLKMTRNLEFEQEPNYLEMRKMFWKVAKREGIEYDGIYDWIQFKSNQK